MKKISYRFAARRTFIGAAASLCLLGATGTSMAQIDAKHGSQTSPNLSTNRKCDANI